MRLHPYNQERAHLYHKSIFKQKVTPLQNLNLLWKIGFRLSMRAPKARANSLWVNYELLFGSIGNHQIVIRGSLGVVNGSRLTKSTMSGQVDLFCECTLNILGV